MNKDFVDYFRATFTKLTWFQVHEKKNEIRRAKTFGVPLVREDWRPLHRRPEIL